MTISLDVDWFYRRALGWFIERLLALFGPLDLLIRDAFVGAVGKLIAGTSRHLGPDGILSKTIQAGAMVYWAVALLVVYLVLYLA
jgi:hypothetical protein